MVHSVILHYVIFLYEKSASIVILLYSQQNRSAPINTKIAQRLISKVVLDNFYDGDFHSEADNINFINTKSHGVNVQLQNH